MGEKALNRKIAELLGWSVQERRALYSGAPLDQKVYICVRPDGTEANYYYAGTEADAWKHAPDYEHDLNAVITALPNGTEFRSSSWDGKSIYFEITTSTFEGVEVIADNVHLAAARALLAWLEVKIAAE
jgi:hypothetical protein